MDFTGGSLGPPTKRKAASPSIVIDVSTAFLDGWSANSEMHRHVVGDERALQGRRTARVGNAVPAAFRSSQPGSPIPLPTLQETPRNAAPATDSRVQSTEGARADSLALAGQTGTVSSSPITTAAMTKRPRPMAEALAGARLNSMRAISDTTTGEN
jgi:hypothetical protein